ncbi:MULTISPECIES: TetR/AcrR family transcriptional regulator [Aeromicrobium]|uniref:TetR/AcrR family transcriptional regulator n=1 Tax=Aeromicrobium TaxID=2040 RepID=UPI000A8F7D0B|nr:MULTISPECIES: TetR/AcrR family transcriptional regulator [Aeromicrobium]MBD8606360.1 TetR/AcrR family transcriptional regulator [Aeromicrobium sp. CFBP 8757]MCL8250646.1 TetR/AcrR family transcriptional regulator [Aeromicrobium fastidiosum]
MVQKSQRRGDADDVRVARTRHDVAHTALKVLTREGWEALSHAHVAASAGYSRTTLYTHWPQKIDLVVLALDAVRDMPHDERTGDVETDLVAELTTFRRGIVELRLDKVLMALAQWGATVDEVAAIRDRVVEDGESVVREVLADVAEGAELEAAVAMLSGAVVCPVLMHDTLPSDDLIRHAVRIVLRGLGQTVSTSPAANTR